MPTVKSYQRRKAGEPQSAVITTDSEGRLVVVPVPDVKAKKHRFSKAMKKAIGSFRKPKKEEPDLLGPIAKDHESTADILERMEGGK